MTIYINRHGTTAQWASPTQGVLKQGEIGKNTTTGETKMGDGVTAFAALPPLGAGGGGYTPGGTDVAVADGGTGASTAAGARTNLSVMSAAEVTAAITAAVAALLNGAPGALDTLKELADAINDDASFAASITTALAGKQPLDSDLTTLAGLTATTDSFIQSKSGAWSARTVAQVKSDLGTAADDAAVLASATTAMNTRVVTDSVRLLRPTMQKPTRFPVGSKQLTDFPSGHSWGLRSGSTGAVADDTTNYTEGSQSFSFTAASGTTTFVMSPVQSPTIDLLNNSLVLKFRVDQWARLGGMYLACTNDTGTTFATTRDQVSIASSASLLASDGEFVWVAVNPGDWSVAGGFSAVNLAAVARIGVYASGTGGAVQVNLQQVWTRPAPLTPCTVIWFDDGFGPQYITAKPYLDKYGFRAVASPIRDLLGVSAGTYMSLTQVKALYDESGWDIVGHADTAAAHGLTNALLDLSTTDGTASTFSSFENEIRNNKTWLLDNGFKDSADIFSWPQGKFDETRLKIARKYFTLIRTYRPTMVVSDADTYPFVDGSRLRQIAVQSGSTPTDPTVVNAALDAAWAAGHTPILTFHSLGSVQPYDYPVASFQTIIDHIAATGYPVKTLSAIMRDNGIDTPVSQSQLAKKLTLPAGFPNAAKVFAGDGTLVDPTIAGSSLYAQLFTTSGTFTAPANGLYRVSAVGGGGGGSGGGAAALTGGVATQVGAAGSGSGEFAETVAALNSGDTLTCAPGAGGALGAGGAASSGATGNAGVAGATGTSSTVTGAATLTARGGSPGGVGAANSTSNPNAGNYGSGGSTTAPGHAGDGGQATSSGGFQGGPAVGLAARGGGGGSPASATVGGNGSTGSFSSGHTATTAGGNASAVSGYGAGGNGGGGGAPGGAGGNGSAGGNGMVLVERIA